MPIVISKKLNVEKKIAPNKKKNKPQLRQIRERTKKLPRDERK